MMGNGALKIGAAVVGGYLAGRSRKGRLLIPMALAGWAAKKGVEDRLGGSALGAVGPEAGERAGKAAGQVRSQVPGAEAAGSEAEPAGAEEGAEDTEEHSGQSS